MHLDLIDLRLIVLIADEGSLTRAADQANLSLSAVSLRIKTLEERIGARIVYREPSGAKLSETGNVFAAHARRVLAELDTLKAALSQFSREVRGQVRVFANTTAVTDFLPEITRAFLTLHPQVNVDIHERQNGDIARAVLDGAADFGVVAGESQVEGMEAIHFATDRLVLAVPTGHPLASATKVPFSSTLPFHHILLREGSTLREFLVGTAAIKGYALKVRTQVQSFEAFARMIEADVGIGILPESAALRHAKTMNVALVPIDESWAIRKRYILVRDKEQLPLYTQEFIALICKGEDNGSMADSGVAVRKTPGSPRTRLKRIAQ
jgi:molybdate transport repressor ModE-like protein